jgi:hypothetical protein
MEEIVEVVEEVCLRARAGAAGRRGERMGVDTVSRACVHVRVCVPGGLSEYWWALLARCER